MVINQHGFHMLLTILLVIHCNEELNTPRVDHVWLTDLFHISFVPFLVDPLQSGLMKLDF